MVFCAKLFLSNICVIYDSTQFLSFFLQWVFVKFGYSAYSRQPFLNKLVYNFILFLMEFSRVTIESEVIGSLIICIVPMTAGSADCCLRAPWDAVGTDCVLTDVLMSSISSIFSTTQVSVIYTLI